MGRLEAIWIKRFRRGPMDSVATAALRAGRGIEGNADQRGKRQVTIVSRESFEDVSRELGSAIDPSWRRANILVSGVSLQERRGAILEVGGVRVRILGETRPCERMDEAFGGLRKALSSAWRGGVYGEVLDDGDVAVGCEAGFLEEEQ